MSLQSTLKSVYNLITKLKPKNKIELSIIIVSWNVSALLQRLVESIVQFTDELNYEIIIIDNDSHDGTVANLRHNFYDLIKHRQLTIIDNKFNAGFAQANNQGLKRARGEYLVFMNPDMELIEDSFTKLLTKFKSLPDIGILTTRLLYADKSVQPNVKAFPALCSQILILLKLHHFLAHLPCLKRYFCSDFDYSSHAEVEQVMGAFILTSKKVMTEINGWNEDYWLWWEDVELCRQVKDKNYRLIYTPITEIIHYEGQSFVQTFGLKKQKRFNRGLLLYFQKHHTQLEYRLLVLLQPLNWLLTILTQILRIKPRSQSRLAK